MQTMDEPPFLLVGTEVSAKYKGAFCEAKVRKVVRNIKCKVAYKQGLGSGTVSDDAIKGQLRVGVAVEVKHPDRREYVEATITKIQDCSQYTVVFDDGDITTLRRTALCLKSGRHFNEMTLDELPLTNPEHFGNPVVGGGRRGRRSRHLHEDSSDEEDEEPVKKKIVEKEKEENIGKVICVEMTETKKKSTKETWFPALVVAPTATDTVKIRVKDEYLVRSFKDGRYYTVPKKEATEFTREQAQGQTGAAISAALEYLDKDQLPNHWDRDIIFGNSGNSSDSDQDYESDSSDDEPTEEKDHFDQDHFVAQLYKFMDDRGTPLNKVPQITNKDVDLYRLFRTVQKLGGYNRVTSQNQWKAIAVRLGFIPATASITNLVKQAYKKFLHAFEEFNRKLGCTMISTPRNRPTKGRSLVRPGSVASPKPKEEAASPKVQVAQQSQPSTSAAIVVPPLPTPIPPTQEPPASSLEQAAEDSSGESSTKVVRKKLGKVRNLVEKFEEKKEIKEIKEEKEEKPAQVEKPILVEKPIVEKPQIKKEKPKKPLIEEKRGRKRKDSESSIKKEAVEPVVPKPVPFKIEIGDKLKVYYHEQKVTYEAKVLDIQKQEGDFVYLVHYTGWNTRYDEWVRRDRIAENLTNNKQQKKQATKQAAAAAAAAKASPQTTTPTSSKKRGRQHSKSESSAAAPPTRTGSPTKSPATGIISSRRGTRAQPRRTSNNTDVSSIQSDSDSDSDEPIKKSTQRSTSSSAASTTKAIASDKSNVTESSDEFSNGTKGRDYDLSQIRSELKGLKSESPALDTIEPSLKVKNEEISNASTKSNISTASTSDTIKSEIATKFSGVSSDSEFGEDDSQSSSKYGSDSFKNITSKLSEKPFSKVLEEIPKGKGKLIKKAKEIETKKKPKKISLTPKDKKPQLNIEKSIPKSVIEKPLLPKLADKGQIPEGSKELQVKLRDIRDNPPDVYEFKEPEPFEFEASSPSRKEFEKKQRAITPPPSKMKKKKLQKDDDEIVTPSEDAFDVLRKSPSFKPLKEDTNTITTPVKQQQQTDELPASPLINKSAFMNTNVESSPELKSSDKRKDEKKISDLESVKKILTDPTFEPPKIEKPSSIAEKLLTVLSQKATEVKVEVEKPKPSTSTIETSPMAAFITKKPSLADPPVPQQAKVCGKKTPPVVEKVDILESILPKNTELSETIQKLESAIQKRSAETPRFDDDLSDSTDSEQSRLVIEDESQSSEYLTQPDPEVAAAMKYQEIPVTKPIILSPPSPLKLQQEEKVVTTAEVEVIKEIIPEEEPMPVVLPMLLCEETIPGSPASVGIKDPEQLIRKPVYADAEFMVPPTTEATSKEEGSSTIEIPAENSPRIGEFSQDEDKSDSEKMVVDDFTPKKRRRQRRTSEADVTKRNKRGRGGRNGASDSEDNSDAAALAQGAANTLANMSLPSSSGVGRSPKPCQYNFLVQLDTALSSNQRISILRKQIQDLQKTYNNIKAELVSIERRRKKLRRREREQKKNAKASV